MEAGGNVQIQSLKMLMGDLQEVVMMDMGTGKGSHADQESTIPYSFRLPVTSPISVAPTLPLPP